MDNTVSVFPHEVNKRIYIQNQIDRIEKALETQTDQRIIIQLNYSKSYWLEKLEEMK